MKKYPAGKYIQIGSSALLMAAALVFQTSAQSRTQQTRVRWEKLVYEDPKALIQETTQELAKNPRNVIALRMRSSAYHRNGESEKGKADAAAALAFLEQSCQRRRIRSEVLCGTTDGKVRRSDLELHKSD